jgi:hypothetical protein
MEIAIPCETFSAAHLVMDGVHLAYNDGLLHVAHPLFLTQYAAVKGMDRMTNPGSGTEDAVLALVLSDALAAFVRAFEHAIVEHVHRLCYAGKEPLDATRQRCATLATDVLTVQVCCRTMPGWQVGLSILPVPDAQRPAAGDQVRVAVRPSLWLANGHYGIHWHVVWGAILPDQLASRSAAMASTPK